MSHKDTIFMLVVFLVMGALAVLLFIVPRKQVEKDLVVNPYKDIYSKEYISCGQKNFEIPWKGGLLESGVSLLSQDKIVKSYRKEVENFGAVEFGCFYSLVPKDVSDSFSSEVESFFEFENDSDSDSDQDVFETISKTEKNGGIEILTKVKNPSGNSIGKVVGEKNSDGSYLMTVIFIEEQKITDYTEEKALQVLEVPFIRPAGGTVYGDSDIESSIVEHKGQFVCGDKVLRAEFPVTRMQADQDTLYDGQVYNLLSVTAKQEGVGVSCFSFPNDGEAQSLGKAWYNSFHEFSEKEIIKKEIINKDVASFEVKEKKEAIESNFFSKTFFFLDKFGAPKRIDVYIITKEENTPEWGKELFDSVTIKDVFSQ